VGTSPSLARWFGFATIKESHQMPYERVALSPLPHRVDDGGRNQGDIAGDWLRIPFPPNTLQHTRTQETVLLQTEQVMSYHDGVLTLRQSIALPRAGVKPPYWKVLLTRNDYARSAVPLFTYSRIARLTISDMGAPVSSDSFAS